MEDGVTLGLAVPPIRPDEPVGGPLTPSSASVRQIGAAIAASVRRDDPQRESKILDAFAREIQRRGGGTYREAVVMLTKKDARR
jgi:hypothetical protein